MSPQTAQAFLDGLPRMRAALGDSRRILGPVAYARSQAGKAQGFRHSTAP